MDPSITVGSTPIYDLDGCLCFCGGMSIDDDGDPHAYHPDGKSGRDYLANAGKPGHWFGVVCDLDGNPIVQGADDPAPGYYISPTALSDRSKPLADPRRYADASTVPYISVPPELRHAGVQLGDLAWVTFNGKGCAAVVADVGPHGHAGEGSPALATALGIASSPRDGGASRGVRYCVFAGSSKGWPRDVSEFSAEASVKFDDWGGNDRLASL